MTNAFSLFRSLVIYGICLPVAIFVGYLLATPQDFSTYSFIAILLGLMTIPLFLRYHYVWLVFSWNAVAGFYFLPGKPSLSFVMILISFGFSFLAYIMNRDLKFISVPSLSRPLIFIAVVVIATARLTGGFGLNVLGSEAAGGKRYILLLVGVLGFFALTAQVIPIRKAGLYVNLFFGGVLTSAIGNLFSIISPSLYFIFLIFPADATGPSFGANPETITGINRLSGLCFASIGGIYMLLARYGITGILDLRKAWRFLLVVGLVIVSLLGGFRSKVIEVGATFAVLFYLEGLLRTRLLPAAILCAVLFGAILIPFANKLPLTIQRSLTFLPLDLDPQAEANAQASTDWRLEIWANVLPTVPQYLILGKGLTMDSRDLDMMRSSWMSKGVDGGTSAVAETAGDYHSGPLSTIIPFGLPGVFGLLWFLGAAWRALYRNWKFSRPEYLMINRFLFTYFIVKVLLFMVIVGSFYGDLVYFTGIVGFSVALNGGILDPEPEVVARPAIQRFRFAHAGR